MTVGEHGIEERGGDILCLTPLLADRFPIEALACGVHSTGRWDRRDALLVRPRLNETIWLRNPS